MCSMTWHTAAGPGMAPGVANSAQIQPLTSAEPDVYPAPWIHKNQEHVHKYLQLQYTRVLSFSHSPPFLLLFSPCFISLLFRFAGKRGTTVFVDIYRIIVM
jgi:hypothetical protein